MTSQKYRRIADDLRAAIEAGTLQPGAQLPTHEALMETYSTTGVTVKRALDELTREGLIVGRRPVGTFVRDRRRHRLRLGDAPGFSPEFPSLADRMLTMLAGPDRPLTQTVEVDYVRPPEDIAERLGIGDQPAVLRHRVMSAGDVPVTIADAYYPEQLVAGTEIARPLLIERGVMCVLTEMGRGPSRLVEEMYVRMPSANETREIKLPPSTPVIVQMITAYDDADDPLSCWISVIRGDQHIMVSERQVPDAVLVRVAV